VIRGGAKLGERPSVRLRVTYALEYASCARSLNEIAFHRDALIDRYDMNGGRMISTQGTYDSIHQICIIQ
jgi:hypothetical protein